MSRKFIQSTTTGAVLPWNAKLAERPNTRILSEAEGLALLKEGRKPKRSRDKHPVIERAPIGDAIEQAPVQKVAKKTAKKTSKKTQGKKAAKQAPVASARAESPPAARNGILVTDVSQGEPGVSEVMAALG